VCWLVFRTLTHVAIVGTYSLKPPKLGKNLLYVSVSSPTAKIALVLVVQVWSCRGVSYSTVMNTAICKI